MTGISPSRALLSLRLAHLKIGIHGCANCQSLLCLNNWSQTAHKIRIFYHVPLNIVMCEDKDVIKYNANYIIIILFIYKAQLH